MDQLTYLGVEQHLAERARGTRRHFQRAAVSRHVSGPD